MAVPDFVNQLESTYVDIRRCSRLDIEQWIMITNAIVLIKINVFILASRLCSVSFLLKVLIQSC